MLTHLLPVQGIVRDQLIGENFNKSTHSIELNRLTIVVENRV